MVEAFKQFLFIYILKFVRDRMIWMVLIITIVNEFNGLTFVKVLKFSWRYIIISDHEVTEFINHVLRLHF